MRDGGTTFSTKGCSPFVLMGGPHAPGGARPYLLIPPRWWGRFSFRSQPEGRTIASTGVANDVTPDLDPDVDPDLLPSGSRPPDFITSDDPVVEAVDLVRLLITAGQKDEAAFQDLYAACARRVYGMARKLLRTPSAAPKSPRRCSSWSGSRDTGTAPNSATPYRGS